VAYRKFGGTFDAVFFSLELCGVTCCVLSLFGKEPIFGRYWPCTRSQGPVIQALLVYLKAFTSKAFVLLPLFSWEFSLYVWFD
jgi:hypothetical protein